MRKITSNEKSNDKTNDPVKALSVYYYDQADKLGDYIERLKEQLAAHPTPCEMASLEKRIQTLKDERRELRETGLKLARLASPAPITPSLARRERDAS